MKLALALLALFAVASVFFTMGAWWAREHAVRAEAERDKAYEELSILRARAKHSERLAERLQHEREGFNAGVAAYGERMRKVRVN